MSRLSLYVQRSARKLVEDTVSMLQMKGADAPKRGVISLASLKSSRDLQDFVTGSDKDIGGASSASLTLDDEGKGVFKGSLRATIMTSRNVLGGYAAFRTRFKPTMFGPLVWDLAFHEYLGLRCRISGSPQTHESFFVNIQTDEEAQSTEIWQHRLYFNGKPNVWQNIHIPLSNFVCTNAGNIVEPRGPSRAPDDDLEKPMMLRERVKTIGISLLGSSENDGEFELGIEEIWAANSEDIPLQEKVLSAASQQPALPPGTPLQYDREDSIPDATGRDKDK